MLSNRVGGPSATSTWSCTARPCDVSKLGSMAVVIGVSVPELLGGDARAFRHRRHLRPYHIGIDGGLANPGAVAAIAAGDHVFAPDQLGIAANALRNQLGMLDEVRF